MAIVYVYVPVTSRLCWAGGLGLDTGWAWPLQTHSEHDATTAAILYYSFEHVHFHLRIITIYGKSIHSSLTMEQDKDFTRPLLVHWVSKRIITIYWESIHMSLTVEADKGLRYLCWSMMSAIDIFMSLRNTIKK